MFKPGDWILYHMPYETLAREQRIHGPSARPFLVVQAWPNEYGPSKHGYNGLLVLDGTNDAQRVLTTRGGIERFGQMPFAYCYSLPEGTEEGMVSATPSPAEEGAAVPPHVNVTAWGTPTLHGEASRVVGPEPGNTWSETINCRCGRGVTGSGPDKPAARFQAESAFEAHLKANG